MYETDQSNKEDPLQRIIDRSRRKKKSKIDNWISDVYIDKKADNLIENEEEDECEDSFDDNDEYEGEDYDDDK